MLFSCDDETVAFRDHELPFVRRNWYRLCYRRDMQMVDEYNQPTHTEEYVILEHPMLPGVAIGFNRKRFL